jgi:hemerythrin-like metal-binding protein
MKLQKQKYPDWIYNSLPYVYLVLGLLITLPSRNGLSVFCGVALMAIGAFFWFRREQYRRAFSDCCGYLNVLDWSAVESPVPGNLQLSWRASFEIGDPVIDAQHRRMFGLCSEIVNAVSKAGGKPDNRTKYLVNRLIDHMKAHFSSEETALSGVQPNHFTEQKQAHLLLLAKAETFRARLQEDQRITHELVDFVTYGIIVDHMFKEILLLSPEAEKINVERRKIQRESAVTAKSATQAPSVGPAFSPSGRSLWHDVVANEEKRADFATPIDG